MRTRDKEKALKVVIYHKIIIIIIVINTNKMSVKLLSRHNWAWHCKDMLNITKMSKIIT